MVFGCPSSPPCIPPQSPSPMPCPPPYWAFALARFRAACVCLALGQPSASLRFADGCPISTHTQSAQKTSQRKKPNSHTPPRGFASHPFGLCLSCPLLVSLPPCCNCHPRRNSQQGEQRSQPFSSIPLRFIDENQRCEGRPTSPELRGRAYAP